MTTTDEAAIAALHEGFLQANRVGDTSFLRDHMVGGDALVWDNLNKSIYYGVDHIVALWDYLNEITGGAGSKVEHREDRISVVGDVAWVHCLWTFTADFGGGDATGEFAGEVVMPARGTEIWQRIDGAWKMVHFHCSSHEPGQWVDGK